MSNGFDAYHKWLIPRTICRRTIATAALASFRERPGYRSQAAADRQMAHVQTYKTGPHSELSQRLLNEISAAKLCLLRPQKKTAYDEQLRQQLGVSPASTPPGGYAPAGMPPTGIPSTGAPRMSNPAAYANAGSDARPGAMTGAVAAGGPQRMPYPVFSNAPIAPPPPALAPPVTDTPSRQLMGTMTILIAAGICGEFADGRDGLCHGRYLSAPRNRMPRPASIRPITEMSRPPPFSRFPCQVRRLQSPPPASRRTPGQPAPRTTVRRPNCLIL